MNIRALAYLASVSVGNQPFEVVVDTGSSDLWILSTNCTTPDCTGMSKYTDSPSLTLRQNSFSLKYLQGSVSGTLGFETVALGPYAITDQALAFSNETVGLGLHEIGNSGILGLAFPAASSISSTVGSTLLENMFAYLDDAHRFFALSLGGHGTEPSFSFGQLDPALANSTDDFSFSPVYIGPNSMPDYWKLPLQAITINGTIIFDRFAPSRIPDSPTPVAVLDSGTTFILGPSGDVSAFWRGVGGSRKNGSGNWEVRCTRAVVVGFVLGSGGSKREFLVDPSDISWRPSTEDGWCTGGIQANDDVNSGDWILGGTFLRNVYAIHHSGAHDTPPSIGLLNMTDEKAALVRFQQERGVDPAPPIPANTRMSSPRTSDTPLEPIVACLIVILSDTEIW
ncbi:aspartic peptidase domain-containing protein [Vararia minispora EC-137]|uniref:Aspartic peptidase domain-containing protein n=1 Tax=Vararia minispora EC-137 TaxID=1314806 RepID=A0ACB8QVC9_9AGAM|nr:aspartic peptidase domain-containing protein [Vararia minispora EC-137]